MIAVLSDIHGNLEALQAVLADIDRHPVKAVYCLGDVIGYGPDPRACLDLAAAWSGVLPGNHDHAILFGTVGFTPTAERALAWTRAQLDAPVPDDAAALRRRTFLAARPERHREGDLLLVHGSARCAVHEYVFPRDVY